MPLLVTSLDAQPGMRLAEAFVYRGRVMLPGGKTLTPDDVATLQRKYPDVLLRVGDPVLDALAAFEDDRRERDAAATVTQQITEKVAFVQQKVTDHTDLSTVDFGRLRTSVETVIDFLKNNPVSAALIERQNESGGYLAEHAGNVFYLSMVLGSAVRDYIVRERQRQTNASSLSPSVAMDLLPLGLGAMLMDVAMAPLAHVFKPGYVLTPQDREAIFNHPLVGADMLPDTLPAAAKMIVRWHHENFDGTGYPHRRPGPSLHVFVRIARICDAFDAATSNRMYGRAKSAARALWEMSAGPFRKCYDPVLMKVFGTVIQPFPVGAKVRLTDGRYAVVVKYNRKNAFQPVVLVAFDAAGQAFPAKEVIGPLTIGEGNDLRLGSYQGEDLSFLAEAAPPAEDRAEGAAFEDLLEAAYP
ncbi:MAG TPA: HD domain-containing phosphohydrolase [Phycisphaerae bacterium]|nr:HD domain-containing phosphohydrolase [Phycisphaerae bacterium]